MPGHREERLAHLGCELFFQLSHHGEIVFQIELVAEEAVLVIRRKTGQLGLFIARPEQILEAPLQPLRPRGPLGNS